MGEQARPTATAWHPADPGGTGQPDMTQVSMIELRFPSAEMAAAYLAWLHSGEAHDAFGLWYDGKYDT